jgi:hypothetical protein
MPPSERELRSTLDQLRAQLHAADALDPELRARLRDAIGEIEAALAASGPHEPSLRDRLNELTRQFEESHPQLAAAVGRVVDTLANMGI